MDSRLQAVEDYRKTALDDVNNLYNNMVNNSDQYFQAQIDEAKNYANTQQQIQQANTDFTIEKINQEKEQAQKDYTREQKAAYVDYRKASNDYGANAEQMAAAGLSNSGISETARTSMYNTYQNRVMTAREGYNKAVQNYNNSITEAMIQNNSILAEIAHNALQAQLELSLQGFQYKNSLLEQQLNQRMNVESMYNTKWQQVYDQMNNERDYAERVREFNEQMALDRAQFNWQKAVYNNDNNVELTDPGKEFGYFSNGYQPKGISGYGKVSKTGKTITIVKKNGTLNNQNVWKTPDGTRWYWDGDTRTYKVFTGQSDVIVL